MYIKKAYIKLLVDSVMLIVIIQLTFSCKSAQERYEDIEKIYGQDYYSGVITEKFINTEEHMYKKVIIKHKYGEKTILFNWEVGSLYDYLRVGDSIVKNGGETRLRVIRNDIDTIIEMKFMKLLLF